MIVNTGEPEIHSPDVQLDKGRGTEPKDAFFSLLSFQVGYNVSLVSIPLEGILRVWTPLSLRH